MTQIIALSGKIDSGKDTVARVIQDLNLNYPSDQSICWRNVKFSTKLKQMASIILDVQVSRFEDKKFKNSLLGEEWGRITVRQFLQDMGTKMREINPNFWINGLFSDFTSSSKWVISDLRYLNEAERVRSEGGLVIRIDRHLKEKSDHISETEMDTYGFYDYLIDNSGTHKELRERVNEMLKYFKIY